MTKDKIAIKADLSILGGADPLSRPRWAPPFLGPVL